MRTHSLFFTSRIPDAALAELKRQWELATASAKILDTWKPIVFTDEDKAKVDEEMAYIAETQRRILNAFHGIVGPSAGRPVAAMSTRNVIIDNLDDDEEKTDPGIGPADANDPLLVKGIPRLFQDNSVGTCFFCSRKTNYILRTEDGTMLHCDPACVDRYAGYTTSGPDGLLGKKSTDFVP